MQIKIPQVKEDFPITDLDGTIWEHAREVSIENYWSGERAEVGRHFKTKFLWSVSTLFVRFEANQNEPLIISDAPNLKEKTMRLWDRDVCEIFVAPDIQQPERYFEFEIAPTGEWIDLKIHKFPDRRETDFNYNSEMESVARIETDKITMAFKIPWKAFGEAPKANDVWKGNLFRCIGTGETRGYLAWQPTKTEKPSFHVPEAFGEFVFIK
jgi:hypothetical protein